MKKSPLFICAALSLLLLSLAAEVTSGEALPVQKQAEMLVKALSFDRQLLQRVSDSLLVGIIYTGDPAEHAGILRAFNSPSLGKVGGLPIRAVAVEFTSVENLLAEVDELGLDNLFIHRSALRSISSILQVSRSRHVPSMGDLNSMIGQGASLGVCSVNGKPKVTVNLRAAKTEGMALSAQLLRVAEVIK